MNKVLLLFALAFTPMAVSAQSYISAQVGASLASIHFPKDFLPVDINPVVVPMIGVSYSRYFESRFSLHIPVQFTSFGYHVPASAINRSVQRNNDYIQIAPQVSYLTFGNLSVMAGVSGGFRLATSVKVGDNDWERRKGAKIYDDFDFGVIGGLQYQFGEFGLGLSYYHGLLNINNVQWTDDIGNPIENLFLHNSALTLLASYRFQL